MAVLTFQFDWFLPSKTMLISEKIPVEEILYCRGKKSKDFYTDYVNLGGKLSVFLMTLSKGTRRYINGKKPKG